MTSVERTKNWIIFPLQTNFEQPCFIKFMSRLFSCTQISKKWGNIENYISSIHRLALIRYIAFLRCDLAPLLVVIFIFQYIVYLSTWNKGIQFTSHHSPQILVKNWIKGFLNSEFLVKSLIDKNCHDPRTKHDTGKDSSPHIKYNTSIKIKGIQHWGQGDNLTFHFF